LAKIKGRWEKIQRQRKKGNKMTEKKMRDCGTSAPGKTIDVDDPIKPEVDCEEVSRIDLVAIDPEEIEHLMTFGNQRVRNRIRQLAWKKNLPIDDLF